MVRRFDRMLVRAVCTTLAVCFLSILCTRPVPGPAGPGHPEESLAACDETPLELAASGSRPGDSLPDAPRGPRIAAAAAVCGRSADRPHAPPPICFAAALPLPHRGGPRIPASDDDPPSARTRVHARDCLSA